MGMSGGTALPGFITFVRPNVFSITPPGGISNIVVEGVSLSDFLENLEKKLGELYFSLNQSFSRLDRSCSENPCNSEVAKDFLEAASWAYEKVKGLYALRGKMISFSFLSLESGPIHFLEEIRFKCLAAIHLWGGEQDSAIAKKTLIKEFYDDCIDPKTRVGESLYLFETRCYFGYFAAGPFEFYKKYADLMEEFGAMMAANSGIALEFSKMIRKRLGDTYQGFGRMEINSPAKTEMISRLKAMILRLEGKTPLATAS